MRTPHPDPRVRRARRLAKALGIAGVLLLVASGAVPLPPLPGPGLPDLPLGSAEAREALRWGRGLVGALIVALLGLGVWERRHRPPGPEARATPGRRPLGRDDA